MFRVVTVDAAWEEAIEQLGSKRKFWYTDADGARWLFKAEERGTGEDWAERVCCELAGRLGLPHVAYELAWLTPDNIPGVVCETCAPEGIELVLGNELLLGQDPDYPAEGQKYSVSKHTVEAVAQAVSGLEPPPTEWLSGLPDGIISALDVFLGYVLLDAWVANQDRHHENWGALRVGEELCLAPTFDHGASLARNLADEERWERLTTRDRNRQLPRFARKASSAFYGDAVDRRPLGTVAAWRAFARKLPAAATIWSERLRIIELEAVTQALAQVPPHRLSKIGRQFTAQLLSENRERLLSGDDE